MSKICEVIIYTSNAALSFNVEATVEGFQDKLASALEEGTVILDTIEGTKLILNAINVVAIEVHAAADATAERTQILPPVKKV